MQPWFSSIIVYSRRHFCLLMLAARKRSLKPSRPSLRMQPLALGFQFPWLPYLTCFHLQIFRILPC
jgi:hypothetical protein